MASSVLRMEVGGLAEVELPLPAALAEALVPLGFGHGGVLVASQHKPHVRKVKSIALAAHLVRDGALGP